MKAFCLALVVLLLAAGTAQAGPTRPRVIIGLPQIAYSYHATDCSGEAGAPCYQYDASASGCWGVCASAASSGRVTPDEVGVGPLCVHLTPFATSTNPCASDPTARVFGML